MTMNQCRRLGGQHALAMGFQQEFRRARRCGGGIEAPAEMLAGMAAADCDAGARLSWAPLLAGVIVPSFGPRQVAGCPGQNLVRGAGDDTGT